VKAFTIVGILMIALGVLSHFDKPTPQPAPTPVPNRPSDVLAASVQPIAAILKNHADDGGKLADFYLSMADVISRDQGKVIQTTANLRELHRRAGLLMFQRTGVQGKYPGLAEAIDKVFVDRLGLENVAFDSAKQSAAIEIMKAIAWACSGGQ
jgi:hypothetical protein